MKSILLVIALFVLSTLHAQETTGSLQGTVLDNEKKPLPGVKVVIIDNETNYTYKVLTDEKEYSME